MGCYHPLKGFRFGSTVSGRDNIIVTSFAVDHIEIDEQGNIRKAYNRGISSNSRLCIPGSEAIEIPCGQCIGCRLDYSAQWASRCLLEMKQHEHNCFLTLTYDDDHLHDIWTCRLSDHQEQIPSTLDKRDLQLFWKRLRKYIGSDLRYYAAGEYGDTTGRAHYHAIVFGFDPRNSDKFDDIRLYSSSDQGYNYYVSEKMNKIWQNGQVIIADASWESAAYTARYVMKKMKGIGASIYNELSIEPEFVTMSRRPGIGYNWLMSDIVCYATFLKQYISSNNGRREIGKLRYFDNKLDEMYPFDYDKLKENRNHYAKYRKRLKLGETSLSYVDLLQKEEMMKKDQTLIFKRISI